MGPAMCLRRQKGLLQSAFAFLALFCFGSGVFVYVHFQQKMKNSESLALKYKQQQEALSGQVQVVYEHRSRLERSLQRERGEHKKTKEDFLVYKLEAQEALDKEKQDALNRYGALSSQHKILKNQHDDVKKQLLDMQMQHNSLKLEHRKMLEGHSQKYSLLQREKESDLASLQGAVSKLREENRLLRKAHQDVHLQLRMAQVQMEEFRQLKEALQRIPSFKEAGAAKGRTQQQFGAAEKKNFQASSPDAVQNPMGGGEQLKEVLRGGHENPGINALSQLSQSDRKSWLRGGSVFRPQDASQRPVPPLWPKNEESESHVSRFMRTVNSLQDGNLDEKLPSIVQERSSAENTRLAQEASTQKTLFVLRREQTPESQPTGANQVHSWQNIVSKVNARMGGERQHEQPQSDPDHMGEQHVPPTRQEEEIPPRAESIANGVDVEELEIDTERLESEEHLNLKRESTTHKPVVAAVADTAQDPNNQGEDEFEEAELERPDFEEKVGGVEKLQELLKGEKNKEAKDAAVSDKAGEGPVEYEEDQDQENEEHDEEVDDREDLELIQGK